MFGYNLVGADICGFIGNTTDNLCARWTNLGAFYPFSRNHNRDIDIDQEPWALGNLTMRAAKQSINLRYSILRYLYSQFYLSSINGGVVFQPLFFQFPNNTELINDESVLNEQIMIGPALHYAPCLKETTESYNATFPRGIWSNFPSGKPFLSYSNFTNSSENKVTKMSGSYDVLNIFMRGGNIIPYQAALQNNVLRSSDLEKLPITLLISPDQNGYAAGDIIYDNYTDDYDGKKVIKEKKYLHIQVKFKESSGIDFQLVNAFDYKGLDNMVENIIIYKTFENLKLNKVQYRLLRQIELDNIYQMTVESHESHTQLKFKKPVSLIELGSITFN
jgi:lysosomal alpha-glucosidase